MLRCVKVDSNKELQLDCRTCFSYYHYVLKRVKIVVRVSEKVFGSLHKGNFMGALELLAELDPFIREHIEQRELRPKPISYLSKTVIRK